MSTILTSMKQSRQRRKRRVRWLSVQNSGFSSVISLSRGRNNQTINLTGPRTVCPGRVIVTLPYVEALNRAPGTFIDEYQFNLNSIFDPNRTGTGHQPMGYDQWANFYGRYRVIRVRVQVAFVNANTAVPIQCTISATNSTTALTLLSGSEQPYSATTLLSTRAGMDTATLTRTYNLHDIVGKTPLEYQGSDLDQAQIGASPGELAILHVNVASIDGSNITYQVVVRLYFTVELFDANELGES